MDAPLTLAPRLDLTAARPLAGQIAATTGDLILDASQVAHLGGLCLQILLAAARQCRAEGRGFVIRDRSDGFEAALRQFGVNPCDLAERSRG